MQVASRPTPAWAGSNGIPAPIPLLFDFLTALRFRLPAMIARRITERKGCPQGSRIEFLMVGDRVEIRVASSPTGLPDSGFGMLKSRRAALPAGLDPATLLKR